MGQPDDDARSSGSVADTAGLIGISGTASRGTSASPRPGRSRGRARARGPRAPGRRHRRRCRGRARSGCRTARSGRESTWVPGRRSGCVARRGPARRRTGQLRGLVGCQRATVVGYRGSSVCSLAAMPAEGTVGGLCGDSARSRTVRCHPATRSPSTVPGRNRKGWGVPLGHQRRLPHGDCQESPETPGDFGTEVWLAGFEVGLWVIATVLVRG